MHWLEAALPSLRRLEVTTVSAINNRFMDSLPCLQGLEDLKLDLRGEIEINRSFDPIAPLTGLTSLEVEYSDVWEFQDLGYCLGCLPRLKRLVLTHAPEEDWPPTSDSLEELDVYVVRTELRELPERELLPRLHSFHIGLLKFCSPGMATVLDTGLPDPAMIPRLQKLSSLPSFTCSSVQFMLGFSKQPDQELARFFEALQGISPYLPRTDALMIWDAKTLKKAGMLSSFSSFFPGIHRLELRECSLADSSLVEAATCFPNLKTLTLIWCSGQAQDMATSALAANRALVMEVWLKDEPAEQWRACCLHSASPTQQQRCKVFRG